MPQATYCHNQDNNHRSDNQYTLIGLGSNLSSRVGPSELTVSTAIERITDSHLTVESRSRLFATPCFPAGAGPDYVNAAIRVAGCDDPRKILSILHGIEAEFGRDRAERWGQRTLDLDLIACGDAVLPDHSTFETWRALPLEVQVGATPDQLILPHPRLQDRAFVLVPLADIAPDWRHPVLGRTVQEMLAELPEAEKTAVRPL
ncbi:2-amino-4-hydroxy-6-hydroxymethyldihydropteridine pyrophosphokinase [Candidatus Rhodobacter oscarellae]|uniref:2-amino-4-hydroxy-6-hydroxymethyldihydropteridine pyrophosphokinase n=1 Tax=Candidatus Rhodobacter oscarellae TaxID=1675527 RepID=A0A0J9E9E3_9RHOB|nr:2-amino-4-hydroxy-6-hydroxymethyldihydropteridine diphosphokinase [Candidatus Rhodobacter lobularis]KMW59251.1 2-amino-4-hydroxy-6-hydroxymethyldihydropteridine pyrophosphokinase [Candidatus Rhodobacter lobularis]